MKLQASDALSFYVLVILAFFGAGMAGDPGLGWHLRSGQWIVEGGILNFVMAPGQEPFSFVPSPEPWVHDQWLSDVLLWKVYALGGFPLLHALGIALVILSFVLITASLAEQRRYPAWAIAGCYLLLAATGAIQWLLRPVLFSFLCFALTYRILYRLSVREQTRRFRLLPLLFLVWANLHPAFVLGLFLLGAALLGECIRQPQAMRRSAFIAFACAAATLLTPYGYRLHESILSLGGSSYFMSLNREWLPPEITTAAFVPFYLSAALLLIFSVYRSGYRKLSLFEASTLLVLFSASCLQRRYIPFYAIAAALPLLKLWQNAALSLALPSSAPLRRLLLRFVRPSSGGGRSGVLTGAAWILLVIFVATTGHLPARAASDSGISPRYPEVSVDVLQSLGINRVFHSPDWGGYLIWRSYPVRAAFIDDRNTLHGESRYREYFALEQGNADWDAAAAHYGFEAALLRDGVPLVAILDEHPNWERQQIREKNTDSNAQAVLFLRKE